MTDTQRLKEYIRNCGFSVKSLAKRIGISHEALYQKIANERPFKASEIMDISDLLNLSLEEKNDIFFARNVC